MDQLIELVDKIGVLLDRVSQWLVEVRRVPILLRMDHQTRHISRGQLCAAAPSSPRILVSKRNLKISWISMHKKSGGPRLQAKFNKSGRVSNLGFIWLEALEYQCRYRPYLSWSFDGKTQTRSSGLVGSAGSE